MRAILFEIGGVSIPAYGTCLVLLLASGLSVIRRQARQHGLTDAHTLDLAVLACASIMVWIGVQLVPAAVGPRPQVYLNALPALGVGAFAFLAYLRWKKLPAEPIFDLIAPLAAIALGIQYAVGTFLAGTAFGKPTTLPWGVTFPPGSIPYRFFGAQPLHPTQLYLGCGLIVIGLVAIWLGSRLRLRDGLLALMTFAGIAGFYLAISPLRANTVSIFVDGTPRLSEVTAIAIVGYCALMSIIVVRRSEGRSDDERT